MQSHTNALNPRYEFEGASIYARKGVRSPLPIGSGKGSAPRWNRTNNPVIKSHRLLCLRCLRSFARQLRNESTAPSHRLELQISVSGLFISWLAWSVNFWRISRGAYALAIAELKLCRSEWNDSRETLRPSLPSLLRATPSSIPVRSISLLNEMLSPISHL